MGICVVALAGAIAGCGLGEKKTYFTCRGQMKQSGTQPITVRRVLLLVNSYNDMPTVLGRKQRRGFILLKDDDEAVENPWVWNFDFTQSGQMLQLSSDPGDPPAEGRFDLVTRELNASVAKNDYDLLCEEMQPAKV